MTSIAIILLVISAVFHAGWNLLGKSRNPSSSFFLIANSFGALLLTPILFLNTKLIATIPVPVWGWIILTGFANSLYYISLAAAYRKADLSIVYPLARSYPVLVVLAVSLLLGKRDQVSAMCITGIVVLVAGCFFLPKKNFHEFNWRDYTHIGALLAFCAALGSAGYSLCDDEALRVLRSQWTTVNKAHISLVYGTLEAWSSTLILALIVFMFPSQIAEFKIDIKTQKAKALLMGIGIYAAYLLVLAAMCFAKNISYVVAFRLLGIPLGAILGVIALKEPKDAPKFIGIALMFIGLVLVALG